MSVTQRMSSGAANRLGYELSWHAVAVFNLRSPHISTLSLDSTTQQPFIISFAHGNQLVSWCQSESLHVADVKWKWEIYVFLNQWHAFNRTITLSYSIVSTLGWHLYECRTLLGQAMKLAWDYLLTTVLCEHGFLHNYAALAYTLQHMGILTHQHPILDIFNNCFHSHWNIGLLAYTKQSVNFVQKLGENSVAYTYYSII